MRIHPDRDNVDSTRDDARHTQLRSIMAAGVSRSPVDLDNPF